MAGTFVCSKCGQKLIGSGRKFGGKTYCEHCYQLIIAESRRQEEEKKQLYDYIKGLFSLSECPEDIVRSIDYALKDGKKISGIKWTLIYYYNRLENKTNNVYLLPKIIRTEYENAKNFFTREKEIRAKNDAIQFTTETKTIIVRSPTVSPRKVKRDYSLEEMEKEEGGK